MLGDSNNNLKLNKCGGAGGQQTESETEQSQRPT